MTLKVLDLFSGIGGFSLGLERAGMKTVAFCEVDKKARQVLKKHWPEVPIFEDVKTLTKDDLDERGISVDVVCGGFPCQDISLAGKGAGLEGERSGLWWEFHRLIEEIRPKWVIAENVSALRSRGLDQVLRSLAEVGYDSEWHCIPASAVGAPHQRDRIWIVAHPNGSNEWAWHGPKQPEGNTAGECIANSSGVGIEGMVANSGSEGLQGYEWRGPSGAQRVSERHLAECRGWPTEPAVGRMANGVSGRVDRLKQLGNAVVPQIPEMLGKIILKSYVDTIDSAQ